MGFPKQAVGISGPKRFRDFRETGPWSHHHTNLFLEDVFQYADGLKKLKGLLKVTFLASFKT